MENTTNLFVWVEQQIDHDKYHSNFQHFLQWDDKNIEPHLCEIWNLMKETEKGLVEQPDVPGVYMKSQLYRQIYSFNVVMSRQLNSTVRRLKAGCRIFAQNYDINNLGRQLTATCVLIRPKFSTTLQAIQLDQAVTRIHKSLQKTDLFMETDRLTCTNQKLEANTLRLLKNGEKNAVVFPFKTCMTCEAKLDCEPCPPCRIARQADINFSHQQNILDQQSNVTEPVQQQLMSGILLENALTVAEYMMPAEIKEYLLLAKQAGAHFYDESQLRAHGYMATEKEMNKEIFFEAQQQVTQLRLNEPFFHFKNQSGTLNDQLVMIKMASERLKTIETHLNSAINRALLNLIAEINMKNGHFKPEHGAAVQIYPSGSFVVARIQLPVRSRTPNAVMTFGPIHSKSLSRTTHWIVNLPKSYIIPDRPHEGLQNTNLSQAQLQCSRAAVQFNPARIEEDCNHRKSPLKLVEIVFQTNQHRYLYIHAQFEPLQIIWTCDNTSHVWQLHGENHIFLLYPAVRTVVKGKGVYKVYDQLMTKETKQDCCIVFCHKK